MFWHSYKNTRPSFDIHQHSECQAVENRGGRNHAPLLLVQSVSSRSAQCPGAYDFSRVQRRDLSALGSAFEDFVKRTSELE